MHWTKNVLVFVPILLAHDLTRTPLIAVLLVFVAFCAVSSGTYLINDCCDVQFDRLHPKKRLRPVASGGVSVTAAMITGIVLIVVGVAVSWFAAHRAAAFLLIYVALSLLYSLRLKRHAIVDVITLSAFYALRVLAGGAAANVELSDWLLAFCTFLFICLALLKRYADLRHLAASAETAAGRGYQVGDAEVLRAIGVSCGMSAVVVFALYLDSVKAKNLYASPRLLWLVAPLLLYWIAHMWLLAHRGAIEDDPIVVAAKDAPSYVVALLVIAVAVAAV